MAKKSKASAKSTEAEDQGGDEGEEEVPKKKSAKKTTAKKSDAKAEKTNSNVVTLKQLAASAKLTPQVARQKLRSAGIEREEGSRWQWDKGSKALSKAQAALE